MSIDSLNYPELDDGIAAEGENVLSADLWISKHEIGNVESFLRTARLSTLNYRTGTEEHIDLARETAFHVVVPRHLPGIQEKLVAPVRQFLPLIEQVTFPDRIALRDNQEDAWTALKSHNHGILNLGCGKGKTVLGLKKIADLGVPAVVIVNNQGLVHQWMDRIEEHLGISENDIGVVQGKRAQWDRPIVLAMIQTLAKRCAQLPLDIRRRFGMSLFDEVHHLSATTFLQVANTFFGMRYGLTATAEREDGLEGAYYAHLGPIFHTDLEGDLDARVFFKRLPTELGLAADIYDVTGEISVGKLYRELGRLRSRNGHILEQVYTALKSGRKVLALTHSAEHPEILRDLFNERGYNKRFTSGAISGKTDGVDRTRLIRENDVTFATFGVAREGLDEKDLDTLMFLTPFKAWGGFQQGKGRVERISKNKKPPIVIVFEDTNIGIANGLCHSLKRKIRENGIRVTQT